jgi:uncharacterized protein (TIGR02118 family)
LGADVSIGSLKLVLVVHEPDGPPRVVFETIDDGAAIDLDAAARGGRVTGYVVEERLQWDHGPPAPAVHRISFVRRKPGLTRQQFAEHWTSVHAPLARRHHPAVWRYVQNVVIDTLTTDTPEIDGIAELGFRSIDDLSTRMYDSPEGKEIIRADVERFIDVGASWRIVATTPASPPAIP